MPEVIEEGKYTQLWEQTWKCGFCNRKLRFSKDEILAAKVTSAKNPNQLAEGEWRFSDAWILGVHKMIGSCDTCGVEREFYIEIERDDEDDE